MRLKRAVIENYRAISRLELDFHPQMNVFFGGNGEGKTSVLNAIAVGLGAIPKFLPDVSSVDFLKTDCRGAGPVRVELETRDGTQWERSRRGRRQVDRLDGLGNRLKPLLADEMDEKPPRDLPIAVFYGTERAVPEPLSRIGEPCDFPRFAALEGAFVPRPDFRDSLAWFRGKKHEEESERNRRHKPDYRLPQLEAVCRAIESMNPDISDPSAVFDLVRIRVPVPTDGGTLMQVEVLPGGGHGIVRTLAGDLARRMAQGNPHLADPLQSEAIVLIDEVDLHLHPSWHQRILPDLMQTFPNAQFLVSTHSPQVLTTVDGDRILQLAREDGEIVVGCIVSPTYGAEAGSVLTAVMGVEARPADNEFASVLREYNALIADGRGEDDEAVALRRRLESISPRDSGLDRARSEINRQRVLGRVGRTP